MANANPRFACRHTDERRPKNLSIGS